MLGKILKAFTKRDRNYISEADIFLNNFDKKNPKKSQSQILEISKHKNIFTKKNNAKIKW